MITFVVHGTLPLSSIFSGLYAIFFRPEGLVPAREIKTICRMSRAACALPQGDPVKFPQENLYFFGWSGQLSVAQRRLAAEKLYDALQSFTQSYLQQHGVRPSFRLITHSHGGNVALQLADIARERHDHDFCIEQLILMACPVQVFTHNHIRASCFKKIYSFYSASDMVQLIDPQKFHAFINDDYKAAACPQCGKQEEIPFFSTRHFVPGNNLMQVRVQMNGKNLLHDDFIFEPFMRSLGTLLEALDAEHEKTAFSLEETIEAGIEHKNGCRPKVKVQRYLDRKKRPNACCCK